MAALAAALPGGARAAAGGAPEVFRTPAGAYAPAAPAAAWARYCGLSVSVAALKDSLAAAEVDWEAVRAAYADGDARFPEWPGVKAFAQEQFPGVAYWDANSAYFDDPAWLDTFAEANIDGDVLESGDLESRVELLEKTALDQVAANLIMGLIEAAADEQEGAWDAAAAVYTGCGTDNTHGAPRNALYDRSDRRGMHFGTIQNGETSMTNAEIMEAFQGGYSSENAAVVARAVQRTAWQSLLRYALFLDGHFEFETDFLAHQAEGLAFWRILEAAVAQVDPERAALITAAFTSSEPEPLSPSNYCYILAALEEDLVADPAFGSFEDAAGIDCGGDRGRRRRRRRRRRCARAGAGAPGLSRAGLLRRLWLVLGLLGGRFLGGRRRFQLRCRRRRRSRRRRQQRQRWRQPRRRAAAAPRWRRGQRWGLTVTG